MSNFKKVLILILILLVLLPLGTVSADTGPKPTMDFEFQSQTAGEVLTILSGTLFACDRPDCQDAVPLPGPEGPMMQGFSCGATSCHTSEGGSPYYRLEIKFSDGKTRQSNVFPSAGFFSFYTVTIRPDDLLVEPDITSYLFSSRTYLVICGCLAGIIVIVILLIIFLIRRSRKKK